MNAVSFFAVKNLVQSGLKYQYGTDKTIQI